MKLAAFCAACILCWASGLQAADLVSGTWTAIDGTATESTSSKCRETV